MTNLRKANDQQQDTQRWVASQASREQSALDALSVYLVVKAKIEAGLVEEAKAIVKAYKNGEL